MGNESESEPKTESQPAKTSALNWAIEHVFTKAFLAVLTILGFGLSIYFYQVTIREPELTYYISPNRTPIVQSGSLTNFSVTFQGAVITGNLSSATIQFWNQGKEPIKAENIRKVISIETPSNAPIYQVDVSTTRGVVKADATGYEGKTNSSIVYLNWNMLEQNDGIRLQVIYGGGVNTPLVVNGVVEGQQKGLIHFVFESKSRGMLKTVFFTSCAMIVLAFILVISDYFGFKIWPLVSNRWPFNSVKSPQGIMIMSSLTSFTTTTILAIGIFLLHDMIKIYPPFGF